MIEAAGALGLLVAAGAVAAGLVALASPKGGPLHVSAGRAFHHVLLGACLVTLPIAVATLDAFLATVVATSAYLVHAGRREAQRARTGAAPERADRLAVGLLGAFGVAMLVGAVVLAVAFDASAFAPFVGFLGVVTVWLAGNEWRRLGRAPSEPHAWLVQHVGSMAAALVAVTTAVGALAPIPIALPLWVWWLMPTLVGVPVAARWIARVRKEGRKATFL